ncbi:hypothetical protein MTO96_026031 [Rhipicephalus appendiculatus]
MGAARKVALWQEVTAALNALGPAVKTVKLWRKYWSRLCYDSRKLARELERERRRTGEEGSEASRAGSWRLSTGQQHTKACGGSRCCRRPDAARPNAAAGPGIAACSTPAACNNTAACPNSPRLCVEPAGHQRQCT